MRRHRPGATSTAAALFALLMLSFASVQSAVMQAAMPMSGGASLICGRVDPATTLSVAMTLMNADQAAAPGSPHNHRSGLPGHHQAACPYCAAAGHAPILVSVAAIRHSTKSVFTAFRSAANLGPRGPPTAQPRARGPPPYPLNA